MIMAPGLGGPQEFLAESELTFFQPEDGTPVEFKREDGTITGLVAAGGIRARRIK